MAGSILPKLVWHGGRACHSRPLLREWQVESRVRVDSYDSHPKTAARGFDGNDINEHLCINAARRVRSLAS
jgi:hypothetical protein